MADFPNITRDSSLCDCIAALLLSTPSPEEIAYGKAEAKASGKPVSQYRIARSIEMKRRQDMSLRSRKTKPLRVG